MKSRGSRSNPQSRFDHERRELLAPDAAGSIEGSEADDPAPERDPRTVFLPDRTRSVISRNESPDVGFEASVNPYRGCEHGCVYCLGPDTPILHADLIWRPIGEARPGDVLIGFDEHCLPGRTRKLRPAVVQAVWWARRPAMRLITTHTEIVTTAEHRWLQARDFRWSRTEQLSPGRSLRHMPVEAPDPPDEDYRAGYIAGLSLGAGTFRYELGWRSDKLGFPAAYWRVALIDREPLERLVDFLGYFGVQAAIRPFAAGRRSPRPLSEVETRSPRNLERIHALLTSERSTASYRRGFVSGFFDADGHHGSSLRVSQVDPAGLERFRTYARSLGFEFVLERRDEGASTVRLAGSIAERIRFLSRVRPAISRRLTAILGHTPATDREPVEAIERGAPCDVVDIQTSTGTFYAAGLATHNCYARPTHEYLGYSAGIDFETRILVKHEAPELLRRALASPRWKPTVVALSGVTDPYQPVERKLRLTRRCLALLAEFRNPVAVVTKSSMVARDSDLLAELSAASAASVSISLTTLDAELQRRMEPRAGPPKLRLGAIERLARAGIPVGVLVAPIVPGLTDHEIPSILEAAARAGAQFAGRVVLRLPHGVKQLFEEWLAEHYPERREKILARLRALHGGSLYDSTFGRRQRGSGPLAEQIVGLFELARRRARLAEKGPALSTASFRRPGSQLALF